MATRTNVPVHAEAQQVFRQFAWNIAGTLVGGKAQKPPVRQPRRTPSRKPAAAK
jgi:hypothetical protein